jgi:hypothetical protein
MKSAHEAVHHQQKASRLASAGWRPIFTNNTTSPDGA